MRRHAFLHPLGHLFGSFWELFGDFGCHVGYFGWYQVEAKRRIVRTSEVPRGDQKVSTKPTNPYRTQFGEVWTPNRRALASTKITAATKLHHSVMALAQQGPTDIYIYIYIERERDTYLYRCVFVYLYINGYLDPGHRSAVLTRTWERALSELLWPLLGVTTTGTGLAGD